MGGGCERILGAVECTGEGGRLDELALEFVGIGEQFGGNYWCMTGERLVVGRCRFDGTRHDDAHVRSSLAEHGGHLFRAEAAQVHFADLQDMVAALEATVALGDAALYARVSFDIFKRILVCNISV